MEENKSKSKILAVDVVFYDHTYVKTKDEPEGIRYSFIAKDNPPQIKREEKIYTDSDIDNMVRAAIYERN